MFSRTPAILVAAMVTCLLSACYEGRHKATTQESDSRIADSHSIAALLRQDDSDYDEIAERYAAYPVSGPGDYVPTRISESDLALLQQHMVDALQRYAALRVQINLEDLSPRKERDDLACAGADVLTTLEHLLNHTFDRKLRTVPPGPRAGSDVMLYENIRDSTAQTLVYVGASSPRGGRFVDEFIGYVQSQLFQYSTIPWDVSQPEFVWVWAKRFQMLGGQCYECAFCPAI